MIPPIGYLWTTMTSLCIFDKENRLFYDLERIWRDGKEIPVKEFA